LCKYPSIDAVYEYSVPWANDASNFKG